MQFVKLVQVTPACITLTDKALPLLLLHSHLLVGYCSPRRPVNFSLICKNVVSARSPLHFSILRNHWVVSFLRCLEILFSLSDHSFHFTCSFVNEQNTAVKCHLLGPWGDHRKLDNESIQSNLLHMASIEKGDLLPFLHHISHLHKHLLWATDHRLGSLYCAESRLGNPFRFGCVVKAVFQRQFPSWKF